MPEKRHSRGLRDARKFGEAPILGRVSRSPQSAVKGGRWRRKKAEHRKRRNRMASRWTFMAAFCLLFVSVILLISYFRDKTRKASLSADFDLPAGNLPVTFKESELPKQPSLGENKAMEIVRNALSKIDTSSVSRHFRLGKNTELSTAVEKLHAIISAEEKISQYVWIGEKFSGGQIIAEVVVEMGNGAKRKNRLAQLVRCPDGEWRIDLDSYLRSSNPEWVDILSRKSVNSFVRTFIASDTYYNGTYLDDTKWQAYAMVSPDVDRALFGYVLRDTAQHRALEEIMGYEEPIHRATLRITARPEAAERQFEITGVLSDSWLLGSEDFDKAF